MDPAAKATTEERHDVFDDALGPIRPEIEAWQLKDVNPGSTSGFGSLLLTREGAEIVNKLRAACAARNIPVPKAVMLVLGHYLRDRVEQVSWACINIDPGLPDHPKILELEGKVGSEALTYVLRLWCWAALNCPDGELSRFGSASLLERRIMRWNGAEGELLAALSEAEILDVGENKATIHNWNRRNPHLRRYRERQRNAAKARWAKYRERKRRDFDG